MCIINIMLWQLSLELCSGRGITVVVVSFSTNTALKNNVLRRKRSAETVLTVFQRSFNAFSNQSARLINS